MTGSNLRSVHPFVQHQQNSSSVPGSVSNSLTGGKRKTLRRKRRSKKGWFFMWIKGWYGFYTYHSRSFSPFWTLHFTKKNSTPWKQKIHGKI